MANILRQRDIIDRRALAEQLAQTIDAAPSRVERGVLLPPLKAALAHGHAEIQRRFEAEGEDVLPESVELNSGSSSYLHYGPMPLTGLDG